MKMKAKSLFQFDTSDQHIACVGSNGGTYDINILDGYHKAVEILYNNIRNYEDILVYPLLFSMRHVIELSLKISIRLIRTIPAAGLKKFSVFSDNVHIVKILNAHNLKELYKAFKKICESEFELKKYYKTHKTDIKIIEAFYFDEKGDAFRYAKTREPECIFYFKSLKITHIPINSIYSSYIRLQKALLDIIYICYGIAKEYELGIYTANLSKFDLINISKSISGDINKYNHVSKNTKNKIKHKYNISNSEFSKALNIIHKHRYMSSIIGKEIKFKYNNDNANAVKIYFNFINEFGIVHPNKPTLAKKLPDTNNPFKKLLTLLNENQIKFLSTFVFLSEYDDYHVEHLNAIYNDFKNFIDIRSYALCLVYKDTFNHFVNGLKEAGQISYLKLVENSI